MTFQSPSIEDLTAHADLSYLFAMCMSEFFVCRFPILI